MNPYFMEPSAKSMRKREKHVRIFEDYPSELDYRLYGGIDEPLCDLTPGELRTKVNVPKEYQAEYQKQLQILKKKIEKEKGKLTKCENQDLYTAQAHIIGVHYTLLNKKIRELQRKEQKRVADMQTLDPKYGQSDLRKLDEQKLNDYVKKLKKPPMDELHVDEVLQIHMFINEQKAEADRSRDTDRGGAVATRANAVRRPPPGQMPIIAPRRPTSPVPEPSPPRAPTQPVIRGPRIVKPDTGAVVCPGGARISTAERRPSQPTAGGFQVTVLPKKQPPRKPPKILVQQPTLQGTSTLTASRSKSATAVRAPTQATQRAVPPRPSTAATSRIQATPQRISQTVCPRPSTVSSVMASKPKVPAIAPPRLQSTQVMHPQPSTTLTKPMAPTVASSRLQATPQTIRPQVMRPQPSTTLTKLMAPTVASSRLQATPQTIRPQPTTLVTKPKIPIIAPTKIQQPSQIMRPRSASVCPSTASSTIQPEFKVPTGLPPRSKPRSSSVCPAGPSARTSISGKTLSEQRIAESVEARRMMARAPIKVGKGIALPPSVCTTDPVATSTLSRRQAYAAENIPAVKMRDPQTVLSPPKPIVGSAFEKRLEYEAPCGVAIRPQGHLLTDPRIQTYDKKVQGLIDSYGGRYEDLASGYRELQTQYKREHMMTPPKMPRMEVLMDVERKKADMLASSAAAKRLSYKPSVPPPKLRPPSTIPSTQSVCEKAPSTVDLRKQYAASIAATKLKPPTVKPRPIVPAEPVCEARPSAAEIRKQYASSLAPPKTRPLIKTGAIPKQTMPSGPAVCEQPMLSTRRTAVGEGMGLDAEIQKKYQAKLASYAAPICERPPSISDTKIPANIPKRIPRKQPPRQPEPPPVCEPQISATERAKLFASKIKPPSLPTKPRKAPEKPKSTLDKRREYEDKRIQMLIDEIQNEDYEQVCEAPKPQGPIQICPAEEEMTRERLEIRREFGLPVGTKLQAPKFSTKQSVGRGMDLDPETQARYQAALARLSQAPCEYKKTKYEQIMDQERIASKISMKPQKKVTAPAPVCEPELLPSEVCQPEPPRPIQICPAEEEMTRERLEIRREFGLPVGTKLQAPKFSSKQSVGRGMDLDPETQARYQAALDRISQAPCESKKTRYEQIMDQERIASKISMKPQKKVTAPAPVCEPELLPSEVCQPEPSRPIQICPAEEEMTRERLEIRREFGLPVGTKLQAPKFSRKQSVGRGMDLDPETQARYQAALDRLSQAPCESKKTRYEQIMDQERIASKISFKPREKVTAPAPVCEPEIFPTVCEPEVSAPKVVELNKMYETYQKDVQKIDEALQTAHLDEEEINELEEQKEFLALELELHKKAVCEQPAMASVCDQRPIFEAESMPSDVCIADDEIIKIPAKGPIQSSRPASKFGLKPPTRSLRQPAPIASRVCEPLPTASDICPGDDDIIRIPSKGPLASSRTIGSRFGLRPPTATRKPVQPATVCEPQISATERAKMFASKIKPPPLPAVPRKSPEKPKTIRDIHKEYEESRVQKMIEELEAPQPCPSASKMQAPKSYSKKAIGAGMGLAPEVQAQLQSRMQTYDKILVEPEKTVVEKQKEFASKIVPPKPPMIPKPPPEKPKTVREIQKEYEAKRRQQMLEEESKKAIIRKAMEEDGFPMGDVVTSFQAPPKKILRPPRLKPITLTCKQSVSESKMLGEQTKKEETLKPSRDSLCVQKKLKLKPGEHEKPIDDPKEKARKMKEYEEKRQEEIKAKKAEVLKKLVDVRSKKAQQPLPEKKSILSEKPKKIEAKRVKVSIIAPRGKKVVKVPKDDPEPEPLECIYPQLPDQEPQYTEILDKVYDKYQKDLQKIDDALEEGNLDEDAANELEEQKEFLAMELELHENAISELPEKRAKAFDEYMEKVQALVSTGEDNDILRNNLYNEYKQKLADLEVDCGLPRPDVDELSFVMPKRPIIVDMEELVRNMKDKKFGPPKTIEPPVPLVKKIRPKPPKRLKLVGFKAEEEKKKAAAEEKKRIQENVKKLLAKQQDIKKTLQTVRKKPKDPKPEALFAPQEAFAEQLKAQADLEVAVNSTLAKRKHDPITQSALAKEQADDIFKEMMIQHAGGDFSKDPAELGGLLVQSDAPKLPLIGSAVEGDIEAGVLTRQIPTSEMNALNAIVNEEIGINIQLTKDIKIPATDVAKGVSLGPADIILDFSVRNPPAVEHHEVAVTLDSFYVENHFQARGSAWPKWFPGFFTAFPGENTNVILQKSPSDVLYKAWEMLKPPYVDPKCVPTHRKVEVCI